MTNDEIRARLEMKRAQSDDNDGAAWLNSDVERLLIESERYHAALLKIREYYGQVCPDFEMCSHVSCRSSVGAWFEADLALNPQTYMKDEDKDALNKGTASTK